jgi:hypothetical protein
MLQRWADHHCRPMLPFWSYLHQSVAAPPIGHVSTDRFCLDQPIGHASTKRSKLHQLVLSLPTDWSYLRQLVKAPPIGRSSANLFYLDQPRGHTSTNRSKLRLRRTLVALLVLPIRCGGCWSNSRRQRRCLQPRLALLPPEGHTPARDDSGSQRRI